MKSSGLSLEPTASALSGVRELSLLLCVRVVHFAVVEDSPGYVIPQTASAYVDQAVSLHRAVAAARLEHAGFVLPCLCPSIIALKQVQCRAPYVVDVQTHQRLDRVYKLH